MCNLINLPLPQILQPNFYPPTAIPPANTFHLPTFSLLSAAALPAQGIRDRTRHITISDNRQTTITQCSPAVIRS